MGSAIAMVLNSGGIGAEADSTLSCAFLGQRLAIRQPRVPLRGQDHCMSSIVLADATVRRNGFKKSTMASQSTTTAGAAGSISEIAD